MNVEVAFVPSLLADEERKVCIVLDVLRASSTLVMMFESGADDVWLAETPREALQRASSWRASGEGNVLVCGEVGGLPPAGFDLGNSPSEFARLSLKGKKIAFSTTNGTRALRRLALSPQVLVGSFLNAEAAVQKAIRVASAHDLDVAIVCAGRALGRSVNLEDLVCAGYLADLAARDLRALPLSAIADRDYAGATVNPPKSAHFIEESAIAARRLYTAYLDDEESPSKAAQKVFTESASACSLARLGLGRDLEFCSQTSISQLVPTVVHDPDGSMRARVEPV